MSEVCLSEPKIDFSKRITEKGNRVCFGPGENESFIENSETGDRVKLRENGKGSYLLDVAFTGGKQTEITVDSGAEAVGNQFFTTPRTHAASRL